MAAKASLTYIFDADLKGVGHAIAQVREDAAVVGSDRSRIRDTTDEKWFPEAGRRGLIVIRRDTDVLRAGTAERRSWEEHRLRGFVVAISNPTIWEEFKVLVRAWDTMEKHIEDRHGEYGWVAKILRPARVIPAGSRIFQTNREPPQWLAVLEVVRRGFRGPAPADHRAR